MTTAYTRSFLNGNVSNKIKIFIKVTKILHRYSIVKLRHTLNLLILFLATVQFPWNFWWSPSVTHSSSLRMPTNDLYCPLQTYGADLQKTREVFCIHCCVTSLPTRNSVLQSRFLETGCITPLYYCCMREMLGVYRAVTWQCINVSQYEWLLGCRMYYSEALSITGSKS